jgi:hypothetical protein
MLSILIISVTLILFLSSLWISFHYTKKWHNRHHSSWPFLEWRPSKLYFKILWKYDDWSFRFHHFLENGRFYRVHDRADVTVGYNSVSARLWNLQDNCQFYQNFFRTFFCLKYMAENLEEVCTLYSDSARYHSQDICPSNSQEPKSSADWYMSKTFEGHKNLEISSIHLFFMCGIT